MAITSTASASRCVPTIIDGGFENFVIPDGATPTLGYGTSDDWSYTRAYWETAGEFLANVDNIPNTGAHNYEAFTNSTAAKSYDVTYKHPVSLCAGTSYDVSAWVRNHRRNSAYSEGCRITALLNGQQAFTDRIGYFDTTYRYLHGVITPLTDVVDAQLIFRVLCLIPQQSTITPRGIKLDDVAVVPVDQYTFPDEAVYPSRTSVVEAATAISVFPFPTPCLPTYVSVLRQGCINQGEQVSDPGFETCGTNWRYNIAGNANNYDQYVPIDTQLTIIDTDVKHTGASSLRVVLPSNITSTTAIGVFANTPNSCAERSYVYSFWARQATAGACTVSMYSGAVNRGTFTPPVGGFGQWTGRTDISPVGKLDFLSAMELRVSCPSGGLDTAVWIDDVSYQQVPYTAAVAL